MEAEPLDWYVSVTHGSGKTEGGLKDHCQRYRRKVILMWVCREMWLNGVWWQVSLYYLLLGKSIPQSIWLCVLYDFAVTSV